MIPSNIEENLYYIELFTRKKIRNPLVGNHVSMLKGHGYDFWDHKKYQHGDDTRKIDWNATARMGYTLIKNTHEEKDIDIFVMADLSDSMNFVTGTHSKKELLLYITAMLAYSALSDQMRIGFLGFTDQVEIEIEPKKGRAHLWTLLNQLWDFTPHRHKSTRILPALGRLRQCLSRMSIVFLISDFFFEENMFEEIIFKQLVSKNDLIPIILRDPFETNLLQGHGYVRFRDLETGKQQCVRLSRKNRVIYTEYLRGRRRDLIQQFYRYGLDFQEIQTNEPFYELLFSLFLMRKR
ncbi:DUF58 domain-containing protein [Acidobacteria bacterium AH-259-D05]|nr:DUF58 domain-containing protein [Acidobacteria bacterium AH-259-D05]